jgi:hypothetical protein
VAAKGPGVDNPSDILTKYPTREMLARHLAAHRVTFVTAQEAMSRSAKVVKVVRASGQVHYVLSWATCRIRRRASLLLLSPAVVVATSSLS